MAGITGLGLGFLCGDVQVLGAPFLFQTYDEVDYVLSRVTGRLTDVLQKKGYVLLSWSEIGFVYLMSNKPIISLEDFQDKKVWVPEGDPISQAVLEKTGVAPIPLSIPDVLLALQTGLVDVIYAPPLGAISLQWFTKVKYLTRVPLSYAIGGVVMTKKAFDTIPKEHQKVFQETFRENLAALNARIRRDNQEALQVMAREGITFVDVSPEELKRLQKIAQEAAEEIAGKVYPKESLDEVYGYLREARGEK
jgi:TRAP-type C4-dicarboxylate transport system substrate-binding protein